MNSYEREKTTIRKWFESAPEKPFVFYMPKTDKDSFGMECWDNLPNGVFDEIPDSILDQEFYCGFGSQNVPSFIAWSENYVYYVSEYDGATSLEWISRHSPK